MATAATITTPEQVPEAYLRLRALNERLFEIGTLVDSAIEDVYAQMETFGVPLFDTDAENEAVMARARALRGGDDA